MFEDLKNISSQDLIEAYNKNKEFLSFLDKEIQKIEKMRDNNE